MCDMLLNSGFAHVFSELNEGFLTVLYPSQSS
jgi:hypothetical protein